MRGYDREDYADFGAYWAEDVGGAGPLAQISPAESDGEGREGGGDEIQD